MKEVTKEEFYEKIEPLDVLVSIENEHIRPYNNLFKLRGNGKLVGKIVNSFTDNEFMKYPIISKYFLYD